VLLSRKIPIVPSKSSKGLLCIPLFLLLCLTPGLSQKAQPDNGSLPKYDLPTETKTKGAVDEGQLLPLGTRKDFTERIIKSGDDQVHIDVCLDPFQEEMGINFSKGDKIAVTGSKVKQETSDVILARTLVEGADTLLFRGDKAKPVWDWRTCK
jgi:hypothetical protein